MLPEALIEVVLILVQFPKTGPRLPIENKSGMTPICAALHAHFDIILHNVNSTLHPRFAVCSLISCPHLHRSFKAIPTFSFTSKIGRGFHVMAGNRSPRSAPFARIMVHRFDWRFCSFRRVFLSISSGIGSAARSLKSSSSYSHSIAM